LGVAQRQYAQTGRLNPRYVRRILLEAFIALWSGAAVGPEGPLVFLSGGVGSFIADRLKLDVPLLVYSAVAEAFGGVGSFPSPVAYNLIFVTAALISTISIVLVIILQRRMTQSVTH
jgi:H+/Cl- antiporter ClcA